MADFAQLQIDELDFLNGEVNRLKNLREDNELAYQKEYQDRIALLENLDKQIANKEDKIISLSEIIAEKETENFNQLELLRDKEKEMHAFNEAYDKKTKELVSKEESFVVKTKEMKSREEYITRKEKEIAEKERIIVLDTKGIAEKELELKTSKDNHSKEMQSLDVEVEKARVLQSELQQKIKKQEETLLVTQQKEKELQTRDDLLKIEWEKVIIEKNENELQRVSLFGRERAIDEAESEIRNQLDEIIHRNSDIARRESEALLKEADLRIREKTLLLHNREKQLEI